MKPNERYPPNKMQAKRPAVNDIDVQMVRGAAGPQKTKTAIKNSSEVLQITHQKPLMYAQSIAHLTLQFASGRYQIDTDMLAAKMLNLGIIRADLRK